MNPRGVLAVALVLLTVAALLPTRPRATPNVAPPPVVPAPVKPALPATEALDEVNATRRAKGLPPFLRDDGLTQGAAAAAAYRAAHLMAGHTSNDFAFLPTGVHADAAGCAAWTPDWGWGACCTYESWKYVGAAWAPGRDGRRYMHLFVRGRP